MPINQWIKHSRLGAEEVAVLNRAFEYALGEPTAFSWSNPLRWHNS
jgi:hypothetical protein